jgi:hypothetical protein
MFIKEKATRGMHFKDMMKIRSRLHTLVIVLAMSNIAFAAVDFSKQAHADSELAVVGEIRVYDSDGVTPLAGYNFPLFVGGTADTFFKFFFINNTGNHPVDVRWNVITSSVSWRSRGPYRDMYDHYEDRILKYSFGISQDLMSQDYWQPNTEVIFLRVNEGVNLRFELRYTGRPNTAETFSIKVSFRANSHNHGRANPTKETT